MPSLRSTTPLLFLLATACTEPNPYDTSNDSGTGSDDGSTDSTSTGDDGTGTDGGGTSSDGGTDSTSTGDDDTTGTTGTHARLILRGPGRSRRPDSPAHGVSTRSTLSVMVVVNK